MLRAFAHRFREPSSWAGIAALLGLVVPPEVAGGLVQVGAGVAALAAVLLPESAGGR